MAKRNSKTLKKQKIAIGVGAVIVLAIFAYLFSIVVVETTTDEFVEGEHYTLIEQPRRIRGDKIEIMEFFSYGCIHCYNFDDELSEWVDNRADTINFVRTPAVANDQWRAYGRAFYAMQQLGILEEQHKLLFRLVHDARRNLNTAEKFAEALATDNVTEAQFIAAYNSTETSQNLARADEIARRYRVAAVPGLVVHGKYQIRAGRNLGLSRMLDVADYLIAKERSPAPAAENAPAAEK